MSQPEGTYRDADTIGGFIEGRQRGNKEYQPLAIVAIYQFDF